MSVVQRIFKRKVYKFAEEVKQKDLSVFVFGTNEFAEAFIERLLAIGLGDTLALIANREMLWIEELKDQISVLIEENRKEYKKQNLYRTIGFKKAEKIIILYEDPGLIQDIIGGVRKETKAKIIVLERFAPPYIQYLARIPDENISVVGDIEAMSAELVKHIDLPLRTPPIIQVPVPAHFEGKTLEKTKFSHFEILKIVRLDEKQREQLYEPILPLRKGDELMCYIFRQEGYQELIKLLKEEAEN